MEVTRQENGYEYGMHVLEIAYQLIDTKFCSSGKLNTSSKTSSYPDCSIEKFLALKLLFFNLGKLIAGNPTVLMFHSAD